MPGDCAVLVAQDFLPLNVVSAQRALRMSRALLNRYDHVYVVCGDSRTLDPSFLDHEYGKDILQDPRLIRLDTARILTHYGYGASGSAIQRFVGGIATRAFCGPGLDWIPGLRQSLRRIGDGERVRVVLATGPPFITFNTVVRWAESRNTPAILDYRDLWTGNPQARYPAVARAVVSRWLEQPVNRAATLVTTVSEGCRAMLEANARQVPIRVLYNSPDRAYLEHYRAVAEVCRQDRSGSQDQAGTLRIVFTGQVYPGCTFAPLLRAIATLPRVQARQIVVHYYGDSSARIRQEFHQFDLADCLVDHGRVTKDDSLRAILRADALLSLIHSDRVSTSPAVTGLMTTKVYDYLLSGRPILNIGPVNAEAAALAARAGSSQFHTFTADDGNGLRTFLESALSKNLPASAEPLSVCLPDFEAQFNAILDEATAAASTSRR
jgi:hypothetical protein